MKKINKTIIVVIIIIILSLLGSCCINLIKTNKTTNIQEIKTNILSKEKKFELDQFCLDKKNKIQEELNSKKIPNLKSRTIKEIFYSPVENSCIYVVNQIIIEKDLYGYDTSLSELLIYKYGTEDIFKRFPSNYDAYIYNEVTSSEQELELTKALKVLKSVE